MLRGARRRRIERWLVAAMALVAVVALVMLLLGVGVFDNDSPAGDRAPEPGATAPTLHVIDPTHPFAHTPADTWADGADGIQAPPAMRVGEFSAEDVAHATGLVRDALVASRLDPTMLVKHDPSRYLSLLAPDTRRQLEPLFGTGRERDAQALVSLIADGSPLLPAAPKVKGTMRVEAGGVGELVVHTNYLFVYAFAGTTATRATDPMDIIVLVRADVQYIFRQGPRWTKGSQGLWYGDDVDGYAYSISCAAYKRGFLAPMTDQELTVSGARQERDTFFDPNAKIPAASCPA